LTLQIAEQLNLKPHTKSGVDFYLGADVEVHSGTDGRLYMIDTARVFPPTKPTSNQARGQILWNQFRPEFLRHYSKPISSDIYSGFGNENGMTHNLDGSEAFDYFYDIHLPNVACKLENESNLRELVNEIKRAGINMRYLDRLRLAIPIERIQLKRAVLAIMVSRVLKNEMKRIFRSFDADSSEIRIAVSKYSLDLKFGSRYWLDDIPKLVEAKFDCAISHSDLKLSEFVPQLLETLAESTGLSFVLSDRTPGGTSFEIIPTVKYVNFVLKDEGTILTALALSRSHCFIFFKKKGVSTVQVARYGTSSGSTLNLLQKAKFSLKKAVASKPGDLISLCFWSSALLLDAQFVTEVAEKQQYFDAAAEKLLAALRLDSKHIETLRATARLLPHAANVMPASALWFCKKAVALWLKLVEQEETFANVYELGLAYFALAKCVNRSGKLAPPKLDDELLEFIKPHKFSAGSSAIELLHEAKERLGNALRQAPSWSKPNIALDFAQLLLSLAEKL
jgi:hypothetical protein